jgi:hypothetical protein
MVAMQMVFQIILLLCSIYAMSEQAAGLAINSSCQAKSCGTVSNIPYPFGIGAGCYVDDWFEVVCNESFSPPKPFLRRLNLEVLNISIGGGTVRVNYPTFSSCTGGDDSSKLNEKFAKGPFIFSQSDNRFVAIGCDNLASIESEDASVTIGGCMSICGTDKAMDASSCNGINCCETTIPSQLLVFRTVIGQINTIPATYDMITADKGCKSAFLVEQKWFKADYPYKDVSSNMSQVPVVLEWGILNTSFNSLPIPNINGSTSSYNCVTNPTSTSQLLRTCSCNGGFAGNPYLLGGCQGN